MVGPTDGNVPTSICEAASVRHMDDELTKLAIELHHQGLGPSAVANRIQVSKQTVNRILRGSGLVPNGSRDGATRWGWTYSSKSLACEVAESWGRRRNASKVAQDVGIPEDVAGIILRRDGHMPRGGDLSMRCNREFFNEIDVESKAYWLGFIAADGHLSQRNDIIVSCCDEGHLEKMRDAICVESEVRVIVPPVVGRLPIYRLKFRLGSEGANSLNKLGIPNGKKSDSLDFAGGIPMELTHHYVRGLFDGDGGISLTPKGGMSSVTYSTKSNNLKSGYVAYLNSIGIKPREYCYDGQWQIATRKQDGINLLGELYKDANVYLERKLNTYLGVVVNE